MRGSSATGWSGAQFDPGAIVRRRRQTSERRWPKRNSGRLQGHSRRDGRGPERRCRGAGRSIEEARRAAKAGICPRKHSVDAAPETSGTHRPCAASVRRAGLARQAGISVSTPRRGMPVRRRSLDDVRPRGPLSKPFDLRSGDERSRRRARQHPGLKSSRSRWHRARRSILSATSSVPPAQPGRHGRYFGGGLFLDGGEIAAGDLADALDGLSDALMATCRILQVALHVDDVRLISSGSLGGLALSLHLLSDHRKSVPACVTGAGSFNPLALRASRSDFAPQLRW